VEKREVNILNNEEEQLSRHLGFLEVWQKDKKYIGLIDCGANVNCIGEKLCKNLELRQLRWSKSRVSGIGGGTKTTGTVEIEFTLPTGDSVIQQFLIMKGLNTGILFGLPFLCEINAEIKIQQGILKTKFGIIEISYGYALPNANDVSNWCKGEGFVGHMCEVMDSAINDMDETKKIMDSALQDRFNQADLTKEQKVKVAKLMMEFQDLWKEKRRGAAVTTRHRIELTTTRPLATRARRFTAEQQKVIEHEILEMEAAGVIEDSHSPYSSDIVLVRKTTGEWRVCIDFRLLNQFTVDDKFPLPPIQDLIRSIRESSCFVTLDLRMGYWQIPMHDNSKKYTAFRTARGLKQFLVMPFGLKTAPATFQRLMNELFGDMFWNGVLVYLDDILIHGNSFEEVYDRLTEVLKRLRGANLTLRLDKCDLFLRQIKYLGFIVGEGVLKPNPKKVEALRNAKIPTNVHEVRSLLGLAGFYRQFIDHYAIKAEPLTRLLRKSQKFYWGKEQAKSMNALLEGLIDKVLANPAIDEKLKLETDASDIAVGAILSCSKDGVHWRPVEFMSKVLNDTQRRWPVHEREAYAIVAALNKFDCYLRGRHFEIITDNSSLQWMAKATTGKISRWAARMAEYSPIIKHKSGKLMEHVDFLSRYVSPPEECLADRMTVWAVSEAINSSVPTVLDVIEAQKLQPPKWGKGFASRDGIIFFRSKYYVPPSLRSRVISAGHTINPLVHNGMRKTKAVIKRVFCWPRMDDEIGNYIRGCLSCQRVRPGIESLQGLIKHHNVQSAFEKVYIDIWSVTVNSDVHHCLTMIDSLTRWVEVREIVDETSESVASAFFITWIARFGVPKDVVSDRGPAFISEVFEKLCQKLGCEYIRSTPMHPEGNAVIETFHRRLNCGLSLLLQKNSPNVSFEEAIALILMGYRANLHEGIDNSPAYLTYGIDLRPAEERDWRFIRNAAERDRLRSLSLTRFEIMAKCHERAERLEKAGLARRSVIEVGDLVLMSTSAKETWRLHVYDGSVKLQPKWSLPYRVIRVTPDGQSAIIKNLVSFAKRELPLRQSHIRKLRFISPPQDEQQRQEWEQILSTEKFQDVQDPAVRRKFLNQFWEEVGASSSKRVRIE
jgi:hypothetical protein